MVRLAGNQRKGTNRFDCMSNLIFYAYMFLLGLYISSLQFCVVKLNAGFGGQAWLMNVFIALHFVGSMLSPAIAGEISDRLGKKPVLIGFSLCMMAGMALLATHASVYAAGAGILIIGASLSALEGQMSAMLSELNPGKSDKVLNDSQVFSCVGAVLGPVYLLLLEKAGGSWELGIWTIVFLFAIATIWLVKTPVARADRVAASKERKVSYSGILLRNKLFLVLLAAIFLYVAVEQGAAFYVNALLSSERAELAAFSLSGFWGGMILLRFLAARFYRQAKKIMAISIGCAVASSLLLQAGVSPYLDAALFVLLGASLAVIWPMLMSASNQKFSAYSGTASGLMMMAGGLGGMVGPAGLGFLSTFAGVRRAMLLLAAAAALIGLLWWKSAPRSKGETTTEPDNSH